MRRVPVGSLIVLVAMLAGPITSVADQISGRVGAKEATRGELALMQAIGMVNDHLVSCFRRRLE